MNTKWLIQSSGLNHQFYHQVFESLSLLNFNKIDFGFIDSTITNLENILEPNTIFISRCSTRMLSLMNKTTDLSLLNSFLSAEQLELSSVYLDLLKNSIDYDINTFDQELYSTLNLPLLNKDSLILPFSEVKDYTFTTDMFIKPSRDLKAFNGGILSKGESVSSYVLNGPYQAFYKEENIVINSLKKILNEYRFFVIKDTVISGSQYRKDNKLFLSDNISQHVFDIANNFASLYSPADIFVMDLAETEKGFFIIEYNCWNSSGLYKTNILKLFSEINNFKLSKKML